MTTHQLQENDMTDEKQKPTPVLVAWQEEGDGGITTKIWIDEKNLDPFKLLFLWLTFNERMKTPLLRACGCPVKEYPPEFNEVFEENFKDLLA